MHLESSAPPALDLVELITGCLGVLACLIGLLLGLHELRLHIIQPDECAFSTGDDQLRYSRTYLGPSC